MKRLCLGYINIIFYLVFIFVIISCDKSADKNIIDKKEPLKVDKILLPKKELRGIWIATAWGLDWPMGEYTVEGQKSKYIKYLQLCEDLNMNAVFFQVRGMGDSFFESKYAPWTKVITGEKNKKPDYDVLKFMIDEAHKRGIQFHAWMNPYRIETRSDRGKMFSPLDRKIPGDLIKDYDKIRMLNPAEPAVRTYLENIVRELIDRYDIDGIHFDDYFYPHLNSSETLNDEQEFKKYANQQLDINEFRKNNVSLVIEGISNLITQIKPKVIFSVSPDGNPDNNRDFLYADISKWCRKGWIDVVIPQLYYSVSGDNLFGKRMDWWIGNKGKCHMLVGYGIYKFGNSQYNDSYKNYNDLYKQFEYAKKYKNVEGSVLYSANSLLLNRLNIVSVIKQTYAQKVIPPFLGKGKNAIESKITNLIFIDNQIKWDSIPGYNYAVYRDNGKGKVATLVQFSAHNFFNVKDKGTYIITMLDAENRESLPSVISIH